MFGKYNGFKKKYLKFFDHRERVSPLHHNYIQSDLLLWKKVNAIVIKYEIQKFTAEYKHKYLKIKLIHNFFYNIVCNG